MNRLLALALTATALLAQTIITGPFSTNWKSRLYWSDPNAPGTVTGWLVYATNSTGLHSMPSSTTNCDILPLLNGLPAGIYTLYTTAIDSLGDEGDPGDQCLVVWPGGNGKAKGGTSDRVGR